MVQQEFSSAEDICGHAAVVPSVSIENLVNMRKAAVERYAQALKLVCEAHEIIKAAHLGEVDLEIRSSYERSTPVTARDAPEMIRQSIDRGAWQYLMSESGMRTFMDATARKAWDEQVHNGKVPELTFENIESTFGSLYEQRGEMFERGVIECFRRLSWDYRTNQPFKFGKKIILKRLFTVFGNKASRFLSLDSRTCNELDDLFRVFRVLDGKPQADHRSGIHFGISRAQSARTTTYEGEYFDVRWYQNGNGHLAFKRQDLVDKMNAILATHHPRTLADDHRSRQR